MWVMGTMGVLMPSLRPPRLVEAGDARTLQVRARVREHLERFRKDYCNAKTPGVQHGGLGPIIATPDMDYQFRAYISPADFGVGMQGMIDAIDWMKFKPQILQQYGDHKLHSFYNGVWSSMLSSWRIGSSFSHGADRRTNAGAERREAERRSRRGLRPLPSYSSTGYQPSFGYTRPAASPRTVKLYERYGKVFNNDGSVTVDFGSSKTVYPAASWCADTMRVEAGMQPIGTRRGIASAPSFTSPLAPRVAAEEPDVFESTSRTDDEILSGVLDDLGVELAARGIVVDDIELDEEIDDTELDESLVEEMVLDSIEPGSFLSEYADVVTAAVNAELERRRQAALAAADAQGPEVTVSEREGLPEGDAAASAASVLAQG